MANRILPPSALLGARSLLVDSQGDGDFTSIQDALNHAALHATAAARWSVRVAPGEYAENLALKDYVDLIGLGPGMAAHVCPVSGEALAELASCTVGGLWLESADAAAIQTQGGFSGTCILEGVVVDQAALDAPSLMVSAGTLLVYHSRLAAGGPAQVSAGTLKLFHSHVCNQAAEDGGANMALYVSGAGSCQLAHCLVENVSPAGYGMYVGDSGATLKAWHTTFRKSNSTYAVTAVGSLAFPMARCCGNAGLDPNLTGYHDYVYDTGL